MSKKTNSTHQRKTAKPVKSTFQKVKVNKDGSLQMLEALNLLEDYVFKTRSKFRDEMQGLILKLRILRIQVIDQVLRDEIKVHKPLELIARVKQMDRDGIISYKASEMTRVLLLSCVFTRDITINRRTMSSSLK